VRSRVQNSLGRVEWVEVIVQQRNENAPMFLGGHRHFRRLELGDETLKAGVELESQQQIQHIQRPAEYNRVDDRGDRKNVNVSICIALPHKRAK